MRAQDKSSSRETRPGNRDNLPEEYHENDERSDQDKGRGGRKGSNRAQQAGLQCCAIHKRVHTEAIRARHDRLNGRNQDKEESERRVGSLPVQSVEYFCSMMLGVSAINVYSTRRRIQARQFETQFYDELLSSVSFLCFSQFDFIPVLVTASSSTDSRLSNTTFKIACPSPRRHTPLARSRMVLTPFVWLATCLSLCPGLPVLAEVNW